jgi:hypothetical protein
MTNLVTNVTEICGVIGMIAGIIAICIGLWIIKHIKEYGKKDTIKPSEANLESTQVSEKIDNLLKEFRDNANQGDIHRH